MSRDSAFTDITMKLYFKLEALCVWKQESRRLHYGLCSALAETHVIMCCGHEKKKNRNILFFVVASLQKRKPII